MNDNVRRLLSVLVIVAGLSAVAGCGGATEYAVVGTSRAAGSDGTVEVEEIEGGNSLVTLTLNHLPPPDRLGPGNTLYMAWIFAPNAPAQQLGVLEYDDETRVGRMSGTSPLTRFELKVTAERNRTPSTPSDLIVAEQRVNRDE